MKTYIEKLKQYLADGTTDWCDGESVLGILYECYNENHPYDNEEIKADFNALYQAMNGMPLREIDKVIYPVCKLCRDHEQAGFIEGVKLGIKLHEELEEKNSSVR